MNELEIIVNVINILNKNAKCKERYASELDNFRNRELQARSNRYRLGVIGVTSSGKSTMINSLLGEAILPAGARPSSSQLVSCFHSSNRRAQIFFHDGTSKTFTGNALNKGLMEKYGDETFNPSNKEKVKQIELSSPNFPFDKSIVLVDSPGLDAYGYANHEQLTINSLLPTIDFCIFVTTCKTNSDDKMLSVLNTIADYEKPVIIVQNMIDSLKPSLDGEKTVADVAQEHRARVERIVSHSNIKDKSKVHIVQISAINALKARENRNERELLEKSNYGKLVEVVQKAFDQVRPVVEGHRMKFLKKEITRIAKAALDDGAVSSIIMPTFEYDDIAIDYEIKREECDKVLNDRLSGLQSQLSSLRRRNNFNDRDIVVIKKDSAKCEAEICRQMNILNNTIIEICKKLNVDQRNILTDFRFDKPELRLKKKTEVVKDGYWQEGKRHWYTLWLVKDDDKWIDTSYTIEVTDVTGTKQNAINYINQSLNVFKRTIDHWRKTISHTEEKLYAEIENRRSEYKARQEKALDCQAYQQIGNALQSLADSIMSSVPNTFSNINSTKTDVKEVPTFTIQDKYGLTSMLKLSEYIRLSMHTAVSHAFINCTLDTLVIGWDEYCESKFMKYTFGISVLPNRVNTGINRIGKSSILCHKPKELTLSNTNGGRNIFVLINATQFGAALKEILDIKLENITRRMDILYLVIQDFNEIMNGNSVAETLDNIIGLKNRKDFNVRYSFKVILLHDNLLYNMAAVEAQVTGCFKQSDEIRILHDLQKKFYYLFPNDKTARNYAESTIQTIIQKLGKL